MMFEFGAGYAPTIMPKSETHASRVFNDNGLVRSTSPPDECGEQRFPIAVKRDAFNGVIEL